jgi:transposase
VYSKADFIALKKESARIQEERDLLKKVLTIFAEKKK